MQGTTRPVDVVPAMLERMVGLHPKAKELLSGAHREDDEVLELTEGIEHQLPKYTLPNGRVLVARLQEGRSIGNSRYYFLALQDDNGHWVDSTRWPHDDIKDKIEEDTRQPLI